MGDIETINFRELAISQVMPMMRDEIRQLRKRLYNTSHWWVVKRYRLHERILKVEEELDLQEHVWLDQ